MNLTECIVFHGLTNEFGKILKWIVIDEELLQHSKQYNMLLFGC